MFLDKFQKSRRSLAVFGRKLLEKRKNFIKVENNNKLQSDLDKTKDNVIKNITIFNIFLAQCNKWRFRPPFFVQRSTLVGINESQLKKFRGKII